VSGLRNSSGILNVVELMEPESRPRRRLTFLLITVAFGVLLVGGPCMPPPLARVFSSKRVQAAFDLDAICSAIAVYVLEEEREHELHTIDFSEVLLSSGQGRPRRIDSDMLTGGRLLDPWGGEYIIVISQLSKNVIETGSYGADHAPGGQEDAADLWRTVRFCIPR
jgi:Type II secretion system (T2SS), protein G